MKRTALGAALVLLWMAARPEATAYKCVLTNNCTPLPCEFMAGLNLSKARLRAVANAPGPASSDGRVFDAFVNAVRAGQQQALKEYRKCSGGSEPPAVLSGTPPECSITPSLAESMKSSNTCSELIDAEYARAERMQSFCLSTGRNPATGAEVKARNILAAQARVDSMEASLLQYLSSCVPGAALSQQLSDAGLDALKQEGQEARDRWKAKRATQNPAYDPTDPIGVR